MSMFQIVDNPENVSNFEVEIIRPAVPVKKHSRPISDNFSSPTLSWTKLNTKSFYGVCNKKRKNM